MYALFKHCHTHIQYMDCENNFVDVVLHKKIENKQRMYKCLFSMLPYIKHINEISNKPSTFLYILKRSDL